MRFLLGAFLALILATMPLATHNANAQSTNNFNISTFDIQYDLTRDENNRSVLTTAETITAQFPGTDQNHGIERAIPVSYNGHSVNLSVNSVTDENGNALQYSTTNNGDVRVVRIGDPGAYVQGTKVYKINYTQHDVTRFYADTGKDEWYWDTNGTQWSVRIDELTVSAKIDQNLISSGITPPTCAQGSYGAKGQCTISLVDQDTYSLKANNLAAGENASFAFGFNKGTFTTYQPSASERLYSTWLMVFGITTVLGIVLLIALAVAYSRRMSRKSELHTIVVEYIPPRDASVLTSSQVLGTTILPFSAQLIDFAVRHFIEIIETSPKSLWKPAQYDIKIITDPTRLFAEEQEILSDMFDGLPKVGDRLALKTLKSNTSYYSRTLDNKKKLKTLVEGSYALREKSKIASRYFYRWAILLLIIGIVTLSPVLLLFAIIVAAWGFQIRPLTDKGLQLRRYLMGLERYIKAAEVERLKFLQGPDTAQKIGESVDVNDAGQLVKLYERVLPYAILFGLEKEWSKRLGDYYATTQTSPGWYNGTTVFNAAIFGATLSSFSASASYSGGSTSSSTGGSGGGGFSGGGGGGGGGGGW